MRANVLNIIVCFIMAAGLGACGVTGPSDGKSTSMPSASATATSTVAEVIALAKSGELTTFEEIIAGMRLINDNMPQLSSLPEEDEGAERKAIEEFFGQQRQYYIDVMEQFANALTGQEVAGWRGWVIDSWKNKDGEGFVVGLYMRDPYSSSPELIEHSDWSSRSLDALSADAYLVGLSQEDAVVLSPG